MQPSPVPEPFVLPEPFLVPDATLERLRAALRTPDGPDAAVLARLCACHRLDALAGLVAAQHGWLGASFSAMELLAVIHHRYIPEPLAAPRDRAVCVLSKGHAALAQYAVLAAQGAFPRRRLLDYKARGGPPAHSDRAVPGVDSDSGSLGQGLSKAIGIALAKAAAGAAHPTFALLGDGELQEGQVFEALLSLRALAPPRCVAVIDRNALQTDSRTDAIKDAADWSAVIRGVGLPVDEVDGHDTAALLVALDEAARRGGPTVVIAHTVKGEGTAVTRMPVADTARRAGVWHGRVPDAATYEAIAAELVAQVGDPEVTAAFARWRAGETPAVQLAGETPAVQTPAVPAAPIGTGAAFGDALLDAAARQPDFFVLDADLEASCRLAPFAAAHPERFVEVGISEQDMVSIAAGLALGGRVAVTNTYAAFYRRAADQVAACAAEGLPVLFVGHYAGLDYYTDGKSHQALTDVALMRAAGVDVFEPLTAAEVPDILSHLLQRLAADLAPDLAAERGRPAYLRLHRTPAARAVPLPAPFAPDRAYRFPGRADGSPAVTRLFVAGPHTLVLALDAQAALRDRGVPVDVVAASSPDGAADHLAALVRGAARLVTLEDHATTGGLGELVATRADRPPLRLGARGPHGGSTRSLAAALDAHGLTPAALIEALTAR